MKIHLQQYQSVGTYYQEALRVWKKDGLIPNLQRKCDGLMMKIENEKYFTDNIDNVTCKRCIKMWNKYVRDNK